MDRATGRLSALAEAHRIRDDMTAARRRELLAFDDSPQGERLRRHAVACDRGLHRALAAILKLRKDRETPEFDILRLVEANLGAEARAERFSQNEPTIADDELSKTKPRPTKRRRSPDRTHRRECVTLVHKINSRTAFEIMGTNPAMTSSRISKRSHRRRSRSSRQNAGLGIVDETPADRRSSGFR